MPTPPMPTPPVSGPSRLPFEVVVTTVALAVAEGYYLLDEARVPLLRGAYALLRDAKRALPRLAQDEAERRGLAIDPRDLPRHEHEADWRGLPSGIQLYRPEDLGQPAAQRSSLALVRIRRVDPRPPYTGDAT